MKPQLLIALATVSAALALTVALLWPDSTVNPTPPSTPATTRVPHRAPAPDHTAQLLARWQLLADDSLPREERLDLVSSIDERLTETETKYLFDLLSRTPRPGTEKDWWVVMNGIMQQMRKNASAPATYSPRMAALIRDPNTQEMARDYAIQHLAQWIAPAGTDISPGEQDPIKSGDALQAISATVSDPARHSDSSSGTALMAMVDASSRLPAETTAAVWQSLDPFFADAITGSDPTIARPLRISAIQAVAIRRITAHLPAIRALATQESTDPSVRLSSIAALGFYADSTDRPYLESLAQSDTKFRHAAQAALTRALTPATR